MINRIIIRIKVLQVIYAYYQSESKDLRIAENELMRSLEQVYNLYLYLLYIIVFLTDTEDKRLDALKYKYLPTEADKNPDTRLLNNRLAAQLRENATLDKFVEKKGNYWNTDDQAFGRNLLNKILQSDIYKEYLESEDSYESDRAFWLKAMKQIVLKDESMQELVHEKSLYISDEIDLIGTFVLKSLKRFSPESSADEELLPMFKNDEDRRFAVKLLHKAITQRAENEALINDQIANWDIDRIALTDLYIMQIALAEVKEFDSIPLQVTLNEYIELARYYSTPESARFINGILDGIVKEMKNKGNLFKS